IGDRSLQNYKFVTTESRNDICVPSCALQSRGDSLQKHIAPCMPQSVVNLLELIQIDDVNSAHVVGPPFAKRTLHAVEQNGAIGEAGQRIKSCQIVDLGFGNLLLSDILHENNHSAVFHRLHGEL